jgi:hypothetical protein
LAKHQPLARREGGNHMDGGFLPLFLIRAAHRLAAITPAGAPVSDATQATKQC